jgi:hypothetical protein
MKAGTFAITAALAAIVMGIAVPAAFASSPDAVGRYVASHRAPSDLIDRWLAAHPPAAQPGPVSDLESSLIVDRHTVASEPQPVSDVASSLEQDRRAIASQPSPVSDVASSLQMARGGAHLAPAKSGSEFAWKVAGVGAGAALLLAAFAIVSLTVMRRHRPFAA